MEWAISCTGPQLVLDRVIEIWIPRSAIEMGLWTRKQLYYTVHIN